MIRTPYTRFAEMYQEALADGKVNASPTEISALICDFKSILNIIKYRSLIFPYERDYIKKYLEDALNSLKHHPNLRQGKDL